MVEYRTGRTEARDLLQLARPAPAPAPAPALAPARRSAVGTIAAELHAENCMVARFHMVESTILQDFFHNIAVGSNSHVIVETIF